MGIPRLAFPVGGIATYDEAQRPFSVIVDSCRHNCHRIPAV